jgi:Tol biopolymer transport system component
LVGSLIGAEPNRIFYTSVSPAGAGLFISNADGSDEHPLLPATGIDYNPSWSPDGQWIAFTSERNGSADLYRVKPDGTWIAFSSDRGSTLPMGKGRWEHLQIADVYLIHPDGSGLKRLTAHGNFCGSPKWSRDSGAWSLTVCLRRRR